MSEIRSDALWPPFLPFRRYCFGQEKAKLIYRSRDSPDCAYYFGRLIPGNRDCMRLVIAVMVLLCASWIAWEAAREAASAP